MRRAAAVAVCFVAAMWCVAPASLAAEVPAPSPTALATEMPAAAMPADLTRLQSNLELIDQLRRQGVEVDADRAIERRLLAEVAQLTGGRVRTRSELNDITAAVAGRTERRRGWFTFAHVLWLVGAAVVVAASGFLARHYLGRLLLRVPPWAWEAGFYGLCGVGIFAGALMPAGFRMAPVLPGCLGLVALLAYSCRRHRLSCKRWAPWLLAAVWGGAAEAYGSETLGFLAVGAVLAGLGFAAGMIPGLVTIGFRDRAAVPRATLAAGVLLVAHVALHCAGVAPAWLEPFRAGMGFLGSFVLLLGLLILASRRYDCRRWAGGRFWSRYAAIQVVTCVVGVATIYFGSVHGVPHLLGLGGT
ncbi:MAG TPA: hypothetical protein VK163_16875, partial [Opitutaceae bacterium]|nr:hypothetical protein [Opitutaceae bacterium]